MTGTPLGDQIRWLKTRQEQLLHELVLNTEELDECKQKEVLMGVIEYVKVSQDVQNLGFVSILTYMKETQSSIDRELTEISEYMAAILSMHRKEAENLEKLS